MPPIALKLLSFELDIDRPPSATDVEKIFSTI
jgi:hypothetical protein